MIHEVLEPPFARPGTSGSTRPWWRPEAASSKGAQMLAGFRDDPAGGRDLEAVRAAPALDVRPTWLATVSSRTGSSTPRTFPALSTCGSSSNLFRDNALVPGLEVRGRNRGPGTARHAVEPACRGRRPHHTAGAGVRARRARLDAPGADPRANHQRRPPRAVHGARRAARALAALLAGVLARASRRPRQRVAGAAPTKAS